MKNIKKLLSALFVFSLGTTMVMTTAACGTTTQFNIKWAAALGWYDGAGNSNISQNFQYHAAEKSWIITADQTRIAATPFIEFLDADKKAQNVIIEAFLSDLGFKSGSKTMNYSSDEFKKIMGLKAVIKQTNPGKISAQPNKKDFMIANGTVVIAIKSGATTLKSYTVNTKTSHLEITELGILSKENIILNATTNYQPNSPTSAFELKFSKTENTNEWNSLVKLLGHSPVLNWSSDREGEKAITTFPTAGTNAFLTITIAGVSVTNAPLDCGALPDTTPKTN